MRMCVVVRTIDFHLTDGYLNGFFYLELYGLLEFLIILLLETVFNTK